MPDDLIQGFALKTGKPADEIQQMWDESKAELVKIGSDKDDEKFRAQLIIIMKKKLNLVDSETQDENLYTVFKNKSLFEDEEDGDEEYEDDDEDYQSLDFFKEVLESLMESDEESTQCNPIIEILYEVADDMNEEIREEIIEGIFDFFDVEDADELDDELEESEEVEEGFFEEGELDYFLNEKISDRKKKRMRFLKQKRRRQLGKRGTSLAFKRTHRFDNKKRKFVKRNKAQSTSDIRKKAKRFNKIKRRGGTKAKAKRTKRRLKNVRNPYGK